MRRVHVVVSGRVQGVSYRDSCRQEATRHGVSGWVRNLPDGRVELVAEGLGPDVEALLAWCRRGPRAAQVDSVVVEEEDPDGSAIGFEVRG